MKFRPAGINTYLCAIVAMALLVAGCATTDDPKDMGKKKKGKEQALLLFHLETTPDGTPYTRSIVVPRGETKTVNVQANPFLDSGYLLEASLVETDKFGGFALRLQFNQHGVFTLDTVSSANRGRRIAILCHFGQERWLAAPVVTKRISDGIVQFTPDLSREEAEYVVLVLNNIAAKLKKKGAL